MVIRRGWWLYPLTFIVVWALAGFLLAPWLVERSLVGTLQERLGLKTELADLQINPFTFTVGLDSLRISEPDGARVFGFERFFVNFELDSLFRWAWSFDEVHLVGPQLRFERFTETSNNVSKLMETWAAGAAIPDESATPEPVETESKLVRLVIADLQISSGGVTFIDHVPAETFTTELAPIDLAIADLSTLPGASGEQEVTIKTESGAHFGVTGSLSINPLTLAGRISAEGTYTPMLYRYFKHDLQLPIALDGGALTLGLDYAVSLESGGTLTAEINNLAASLTDLAVKQPDHADLVRLGAATISGGSLRWPDQIVHVDEVHLERVSVDAYRDPQGNYLPLPEVAEVAPEIPPSAEPTSTPGDEPGGDPWQIEVAQLRLSDWRLSHTDLALGTVPDGAMVISDLDLTITELSNEAGRDMPFQIGLALARGGTVSVEGSARVLPDLTVQGSIAARNLALDTLQPYLGSFANVAIEAGNASLSGSVSSTPDEAFRYAGDFRIDSLSLVDRLQEEALLSWSALAIDQMQVTNAGLSISELSLAEPYVRIEIEPDGSTNIARTVIDRPVPEKQDVERDPGATAEMTSAEPFALEVGQTTVTNASAHYTDLALPLPFDAAISKLNGTLSTLASASTEPARVNFEGQVNEYGHLLISGALQPFRPTAGTDVSVQFENVNLPRMSPYTIKFAGRQIDDGRTDLDLDYRLVDGNMEGRNRLVVRDLRLGEKVEHPDAMDLPLDLAVALLRDSSGVVDLEFPVSGSLDDPEFSYSSAVMKAFSNVILGLVTAPFRLLGSLVGLAAQDMESVSFPPGRSDLTPPQRETLGQLAEALVQRPELRLEVPPVLDPDTDRRALAGMRIDAQIEARLQASESDESADGPMLAERRRRVLESLHGAAGIMPDRAALKAQHSPVDTDGKPVLDELAYTESLRTALIEAVLIPQAELVELAQRRAASVIEQLTAAGTLTDARITQTDMEAVRADDDNITMPLALSVAR